AKFSEMRARISPKYSVRLAQSCTNAKVGSVKPVTLATTIGGGLLSGSSGPLQRLQMLFNGLGQSRDGRADRLSRIAAESHEQGGPRRCVDIQSAHGAGNDVMAAGRALDRDIGESSPEIRDEMHSLVRRVDDDCVAQPLSQGGDKAIALVAVLQA